MRHTILIGVLAFVVGCGTQDEDQDSILTNEQQGNFLDRRIAVATLDSVLEGSGSVMITLDDARHLLGTILMMGFEVGPTADSMTIREIIAWHSAWADEMGEVARTYMDSGQGKDEK